MTHLKRLLSLVLLCALCAVCACAAAGDVSIVLEEMEEVYEVGGAMLATLRAVFPQVEGMRDQDAMACVNAAIWDFIRTDGGFDVACEYAEDDYDYAPELFDASNYWVEANVRAELLRDDTLLAVRYDFWFYANGAHPWDTIATLHFDLTTGAAVTLNMLASDPQALRARVAAEIFQWIDQSGFYVFDEAEEMIREWPFKQGLLTGEGLLVYFNEGEIGPVSEGAAEVLIPYDRLDGVLGGIGTHIPQDVSTQAFGPAQPPVSSNANLVDVWKMTRSGS